MSRKKVKTRGKLLKSDQIKWSSFQKDIMGENADVMKLAKLALFLAAVNRD